MQVEELRELSIVERFRESHHAVAKMFASGMPPDQIRQRTGYSTRRLTLLFGDPSFQELIAVYAQRVDERWNANLDTFLDLGMGNMIRAEAQIAEHLDKSEDTGELLPLGALDRISQGRADRFGYSKHAIVEHKHDFAAMLDKAIARSGKAEVMKQIEGRATEVPPKVSTLPAPPEVQPEPSPVRKASGIAGPRSFAAILEPVKRRRVA